MTTLPVAPLAVATTARSIFRILWRAADGRPRSFWSTPPTPPSPGTCSSSASGSETEAADPATLTLADGRSGSDILLFDFPTQCGAPPHFRFRRPREGWIGPRGARPRPTRAIGRRCLRVRKGGITVSEAGVPASTAGAAFRVYVEASGTPQQPHSVRAASP